MAEDKGRKGLGGVISILLVAIIILQPTQYGWDVKELARTAFEKVGLIQRQAPPAVPEPVDQEEETAPVPEGASAQGLPERIIDAIPSANLTIADALVWFTFLLFLLNLILSRGAGFRFMPLPVIVFFVWAVLSIIPALKTGPVSLSRDKAIKELVQYAEYFIAVYLLYLNSVRTPQGFRRMVYALLIANTGVIAIGAMQYMSTAEYAPSIKVFGIIPNAMDVRSTFGNRNVLGGYLALTLPLMWGIVLGQRGIIVRLWLAVLTIVGVALNLSGGAMLAIVFSILVITFIRSEKVFVILVVLVVVGAVAVKPYLPRDNARELRESVLLHKGEEAWPWQQRYVEWQAALNAMYAHPLFGVGAGNYQLNINRFYDDIQKPAENLMEPDAVNGLFVVGATMGVPGLLALLWIVLLFQKKGSLLYSSNEPGLEKGFGLGVYGALWGFLIASLFTNLMVRGVGICFVLILAIADAVQRPVPEAEEEQEREQE